MKRSKLIHDIGPVRDQWGRNYAYIEYLRIGLLRKFAKTIEVK